MDTASCGAAAPHLCRAWFMDRSCCVVWGAELQAKSFSEFGPKLVFTSLVESRNELVLLFLFYINFLLLFTWQGISSQIFKCCLIEVLSECEMCQKNRIFCIADSKCLFKLRGVKLSRTLTDTANVADIVNDIVSTDTVSTLPLLCFHNFVLALSIFSDFVLVGLRFYKEYFDFNVIRNFLRLTVMYGLASHHQLR
jgi:hypothetical protein